MKNFINIADFSRAQLQFLLKEALADKQALKAGTLEHTLAGKTLAMYFEKPSLRTRVSFESGMIQLGGGAIYLTQNDIGLGRREPVQDVARVLGRMCDAIMARTFSHQLVEELGHWSPVPVINALTDYSHPCQAMADLMTVQEHFGTLEGRALAFVGDGNNVARSLAVACSKLGMGFRIATPEGYELTDCPVNDYLATTDPRQAVDEADVVYTDTWVSMGQEEEKAKRVAEFKGFEVNADLMAAAPNHAIVLHCLPAYRGYEISDDIFETHADHIITEAENRQHLQRTLVNLLVNRGELPSG
ncbi:MAG: ornithine carbamoyltransferase [Phycisphaerae bacterium]